MLILTRKQGQSIYIGDGVIVRVVEVKGHQVRLGIEAGKDIKIYREEIWQQIQEQNQEAASTTASDFELEGLTAAWKGRSDTSKPRTALSGIKIEDLKLRGAPLDSGSVEKESATGSSTEGEPQVVVRKKRKKKDD